MRNGEKQMFKNYMKRFLNPNISFGLKVSAFRRYIVMGIELIFERIRGLDYNMVYLTDVDEEYQRGQGSYTKTPKHVLKRVFTHVIKLNISEKLNFMDIGCGKGYVVTQAVLSGIFSSVGGVEYNNHLYTICTHNLGIKHIDSDTIFHGDAMTYEGYGNYNIFFLNNPFSTDILRKVVMKMVNAHRDNIIYLYYMMHNTKNEKFETLEEVGFKKIDFIQNKYEHYFDITVFELRNNNYE